jgi:hypothetical protein
MNRDDVRLASGGRAYARPVFVSLEGKELLSFVRSARSGRSPGDTGPVPVVEIDGGRAPSSKGAA